MTQHTQITIIQSQYGDSFDKNEYEKQKRIAEAAPELLEALEWCLMVYGNDWPENASIRDTIAKARGES